MALGAALVVPWTVHGRDTVPSSERAQLQAVAAEVAAHTAPSQSVVCDLPVVGLLAGRAAEPATVDPSYVRVQTGALPPSAIEAAAGEAGAACVGRAFRRVPGVRAALDRRFAVMSGSAGSRCGRCRATARDNPSYRFACANRY